MKAGTTALLIFVLSILAVHVAWLYSVSTKNIPWCFPYIEGCVTISRAARSSDGIFFFKTLMYVVAPLLIWYWHCAYQELRARSGEAFKGLEVMRILGCIGAVFLVLYVYNLGLEGDFYRWMRRYGVIIYFSFTALAQIFFVQRLLIIGKDERDRQATKLARCKQLVCFLQWSMGLVSIPLGLVLKDEAKDIMNNVIEWNFALAMNSFFLISYALFRYWRVSRRHHPNTG